MIKKILSFILIISCTIFRAEYSLATELQNNDKVNKKQIMNKKDVYSNLLFTRLAFTNKEFFNKLLSLGADVNFVRERGFTPLSYAISESSRLAQKDCGMIEEFDNMVYPSIKLLIENGANPNIAISANFATVAYARIADLKYLVNNGLDINYKDEYGRNILFYVRGLPELKYLVSQGLDINAQDKEQFTPLFQNSCLVSNVNDLKELEKLGLDINHTSRYGSLLHLYANKLDIVKYLIVEKKLSIFTKDFYDVTALEVIVHVNGDDTDKEMQDFLINLLNDAAKQL